MRKIWEAIKRGFKPQWGEGNFYEPDYSAGMIIDPQQAAVMAAAQTREFVRGDKVGKVGGDYTFDGIVVSSFLKLSGQRRYAVEDDRGVVHIYSAKNLRPSG